MHALLTCELGSPDILKGCDLLSCWHVVQSEKGQTWHETNHLTTFLLILVIRLPQIHITQCNGCCRILCCSSEPTEWNESWINIIFLPPEEVRQHCENTNRQARNCYDTYIHTYGHSEMLNTLTYHIQQQWYITSRSQLAPSAPPYHLAQWTMLQPLQTSIHA